MKISYNGEIAQVEETRCSQDGWLSGNGVFETLLTVDSRPYALARHLARAEKSAKTSGFDIGNTVQISKCIEDLLVAESHNIGLLRVSFGNNGDWAAVHLPYKRITTAAKVKVESNLSSSEAEGIKRYPYEHRLAILKEAKRQGFDEVVIANIDGKITEGAVSNLIVQIDGKWLTAPTSDGLLPGIMRDLVIENCEVVIASIDLSQIIEVTSAFLLSSLRIAQPIASIDGQSLVISHQFSDEIHAMAVMNSIG